MWNALTQLLLGLHASGISHEAVIEIMIALLGVMLTVFGLGVGLFGFFGYSAIRDEAVKRATERAEEVAREVASAALRDAVARSTAADYSEAQKQRRPRKPKGEITNPSEIEGPSKPGRRIRKATTDSNLKREDRQ